MVDSSFLQSGAGHAIRKVGMSSEKVSDVDCSTWLSFLVKRRPSAVRIIEREVSADLPDTLKAEEDRKANCAGVVEVRKKEMATLTTTTEAKLIWLGELAVAVVKAFSLERVQQPTVEWSIVTPATSLVEKIADVPKIQTQEKIIEVPEVLQQELEDVNLIMMKVGSGRSRDVAGGTPGDSPKDF